MGDISVFAVDGSCAIKDNEPSASSEITCEPYLPYDRSSKNSGKTSSKVNQKLLNFIKNFSSEHWARYLKLTVLSGSFSAAELEGTLLTIHATRELKFKPLTSFQWLIKTTTIQLSEKYLTIKKIGKAEVKVEKRETLNSIQSTVVLAPSYNDEGLLNHNLILMFLRARGYDCRKVDL